MMRRPLSPCRMEFQLMFMQKLDSLLSPLGSHFCGSLTGIPASLLLQGVSIYTANKLNFSFMTPTTVSRPPSTEYAGATLPDNCVAIVKSLPGDRTLPGCPLAAWHWRLYMTGDKSASPKTLTPSASGVDVACGRKASRSLSPSLSLSLPFTSPCRAFTGCFVSHLVLCCRCDARESFGCPSVRGCAAQFICQFENFQLSIGWGHTHTHRHNAQRANDMRSRGQVKKSSESGQIQK